MEISKWKRENKEPIPLCLVDFETLEIYSLQDWKYRIIGYEWIMMIGIYRASRSAAFHPKAVRGHFGNPALASR